jgi:hypothetical protein
MENNRQAARNARARKKTQLDFCVNQIQVLSDQIVALQVELTLLRSQVRHDPVISQPPTSPPPTPPRAAAIHPAAVFPGPPALHSVDVQLDDVDLDSWFNMLNE